MVDYYDNIGLSEQPISADVRFLVDQGREKDTDFLGAAFQEAMSPFAMKRIYDRRSSQFQADSDWAITEDIKKDLDLNYNQKETDYLTQSRSENEFLSRKKYIQEDRDRMMAIGQAGGKGILANMAFSLFDPVGIAAGALTGGLGFGAKATGLAKAARVGLLSGLENAAVESILMQGNTQSEATDLITAFAGGAVIGGAMSPFFHTRKPGAAKLIDDAEHSLRADAENFVSSEAIKGFDHPTSGYDMPKVRRHINTRQIELERAYDSGAAWSNRKIGETKAKIKKLEAEVAAEDVNMRNAQKSVEFHRNKVLDEQRAFIKKAQPKREAIKAEYAEKLKAQRERIKKVEKRLESKDTPKTQAKLWKEEEKLRILASEQTAALNELEVKLKGRVNAAEFKLRQRINTLARSTADRRDLLTTRLMKSRNDLQLAYRSRKAGKELKLWNNMTDEQKTRHLFGDKVPTKEGEVARQIRGFKAIDPDVRVSVAETVDIETLPDGVEASTVQAQSAAPLGSAGAAQAGFKQIHRLHKIGDDAQSKLAQFARDGGSVPDDLRGRQILPNFTRKLQAIHTRLSNSDNMVVRGLNYHLFEAGQGGSANPDGTAALMSDIYGKQFRSAMRGRLRDGMDTWRRNQGISQLDMIFKPKNASSFYKKVMIETAHPGSFSDEGIISAAAGVRDQLQMAGRSRKAAGEAGFENLDLDPNYITRVVDESLIKTACHQHGKEKVAELLSESYQRGKYNLDKATADYIARGYVARSLDHSLTMRSFSPNVSTTDIDRIAESLRKAGVPDDIIKEFMEETAQSNLSKGISNRAKKSFEPDLRTELNGLKMIDLIDSDLPKLLESYTREAAGGTAMARLGFKTRRQALEFLNDVQKGAENNGLDLTATAEEIQVIEDGINLIYGRSINTEPGSAFVRNLSRLRDATAFLRLQTMGVSTIPELARVTAQRGLANVLEACPDLGAIAGTKGLREGGTHAGRFLRKDLDELEQMLYYVGEDHVMYPGYLRVDNIEESALYNSLGGMVDNALAQGKKVQEIISAFRMVQGSGEKLAVRSLGIQIKKWVDDLGDGLSKANINDAGWHDGFMDELRAWMKANPQTTVNNGKEVRMFNFGKMPPDMQEKLVLGMHRLVSRDMQRPLIGETPTFMKKWFGQTLTQFRNFSITSLGKQLMHDIRHDRIAGSIIAMHSLAMSFAAYSISTLHRAIGREDQEEYLKKAFRIDEIIFGSLNRMGQLASVGIAGDMLATLGALPDDMMAAPGQSGYRGMTSTSVPILGAGGDVKGLIKDTFDAMKGDGNASKFVKDLQKVTPFGKAIGINQAFNAVSGALD